MESAMVVQMPPAMIPPLAECQNRTVAETDLEPCSATSLEGGTVTGDTDTTIVTRMMTRE